MSEGHVHDARGHKTATSSEHGEKREEEEKEKITEKTGIFFFICSGGNVLVDLCTVVYFLVQ